MHPFFIALYSHPVFVLLNSTKPFQTESDAFDITVSGVIIQAYVFFHKTIAFLSKTATISEKKYSVFGNDLLEIVISCKTWGPYIDGQRTVVITDHKPLIHLCT